MHRSTANQARDARPLADIGIVTFGAPTFQPFNIEQGRLAQELRYALFLCGLANNTRLSGPNAGHSSITADSFDLIRQTFTLDGDYFSESTGAIVQFRIMGYKISETRLPKPSYVPDPISFSHDQRLFEQLVWLGKRDRPLYRRMLRATAVFLDSYHNTPAVDIGARVLLQASAFEILLDLPDKDPRKVFKDTVEHFCNTRAERRYRYKFEVRSGRLPETRSLKGIWADRFYTLRNHIIHGEMVRPSEYTFRQSQHHVLIAAMFFVFLAKRLIDTSRMAKGLTSVFFERIDWSRLQEADEFEPELNGFELSPDFAAMYGL